MIAGFERPARETGCRDGREPDVDGEVSLGFKNPSKWWLLPLLRASASPVSATQATPRVPRNAVSCATLLLLLQKTMTLDSLTGLPAGRALLACVRASSAHTRRMRRSISASLFPPVHLACSVRRVLGRWCSFGDARRISAGWWVDK